MRNDWFNRMDGLYNRLISNENLNNCEKENNNINYD